MLHCDSAPVSSLLATLPPDPLPIASARHPPVACTLTQIVLLSESEEEVMRLAMRERWLTDEAFVDESPAPAPIPAPFLPPVLVTSPPDINIVLTFDECSENP